MIICHSCLYIGAWDGVVRCLFLWLDIKSGLMFSELKICAMLFNASIGSFQLWGLAFVILSRKLAAMNLLIIRFEALWIFWCWSFFVLYVDCNLFIWFSFIFYGSYFFSFIHIRILFDIMVLMFPHWYEVFIHTFHRSLSRCEFASECECNRSVILGRIENSRKTVTSRDQRLFCVGWHLQNLSLVFLL